MINLAVALTVGLLSGLLLGVWLTPLEALLPGLVVAVGFYVFIARRTNRRIENIMVAAQQEVMTGARAQNELVRERHWEKAVQIMDRARAYSRWQFMVERSINSQIGSLYYMQKEFKKAQPLLEHSDPRSWIPRVMLACLHYRQKDYTKMDTTFEDAAQYSKKQGLLYSVWAYCHWKNDNSARAIAVLSKGDQELEGKDDKLKQNLLNLQNGKKMKLKAYGPDWYQFMLERPEDQRQQVKYR